MDKKARGINTRQVTKEMRYLILQRSIEDLSLIARPNVNAPVLFTRMQ